MRAIKLIVEKHPDGYVAYPLGLKGVVVGDSYEEALANIQDAIEGYLESLRKHGDPIPPPITGTQRFADPTLGASGFVSGPKYRKVTSGSQGPVFSKTTPARAASCVTNTSSSVIWP